MEAPWTKSPEEILEHFTVDPNRGLSSDQALKHAEIYGKNGMFEASSSIRYLIAQRIARGTPNSTLGTNLRAV